MPTPLSSENVTFNLELGCQIFFFVENLFEISVAFPQLSVAIVALNFLSKTRLVRVVITSRVVLEKCQNFSVEMWPLKGP